MVQGKTKIREVKQLTKKWLDIKKKYFGANDIASLLGCGFLDQSKLIDLKINKQEQEFTAEALARMSKGNRYESVIRDLCAKRHNITIEDTGLRHHPQYKYITASPDGFAASGIKGTSHLTEFKVIDSLNYTIPLKYWVQMQVQMDVWDVGHCLYSENSIQELTEQEYLSDSTDTSKGMLVWEGQTYYWKLINFYEHMVERDPCWFQQVLPDIQKCWDLICYGRITSSIQTRSCTRKRLRPDSRSPSDLQEAEKELKRRRLFADHDAIYPTRTSNWVLKDPLLDWLNLYENPELKDPTTRFSLRSFIGRKASQFKRITQDYIARNSSFEVVDIDKFDWTQPNDVKQESLAMVSYEGLQKTQKAIEEKVEVILNPHLATNDFQLMGKGDMLVRSDLLEQLLGVDPVDVVAQPYSLVSIKYGTINLRANGIHLLSNPKQNVYKAHLYFLNMCLDETIKTAHTKISDRSYIIGRKYDYKSKGTSYKIPNALAKIGVVDFTTVDAGYPETVQSALEWLDRVKSDEMRQMDPMNPSDVEEMYPNMKNTRDHPWHQRKKEIAKQIGEITLMYGCSTKSREFAHNQEVYHWKDLTEESLATQGELTLEYITNFVDQGKRGDNMDMVFFPSLDQLPIMEFYVDFETTNDLDDDFSKFPESNGTAMIFQIGCVSVNNLTGERSYESYVADRLTSHSEGIMIHKWLQNMQNMAIRAGAKQNDPLHVYHWSHAEKWMLSRAHKTNNLGATYKNLEMIDLCKAFKDAGVVIPGQFGYGLKEMASLMHQNGMINTIWQDGYEGTQVMVCVWESEKLCREQHYQNLSETPYMNDVIQYNYVDCKVMEEMLNYIREKYVLT